MSRVEQLLKLKRKLGVLNQGAIKGIVLVCNDSDIYLDDEDTLFNLVEEVKDSVKREIVTIECILKAGRCNEEN